MLRKCFLLFTQLLLLCLTANAAVFVVTSNADAGPGTLRQALLDAAANGSTDKDFIHFNIADQSEAGRTITIITLLPDVSSNLVIDASTQSGNKFGVSDAKIALFCQIATPSNAYGLRINAQIDVEIYSLYVKYLADLTASQTYFFESGIEIHGGKNIRIGAAGKGNVLVDFYAPFSVNQVSDQTSLTENIRIQANFLGIDKDGKTLSRNPTQQLAINSVVGELYIGGTEIEGNIFPLGLGVNQSNYAPEYDGDWAKPATITIKNNKIGVDYTGQTPTFSTNGIYLGATNPGGRNKCYIEDNVISVKDGQPAIFSVNAAYPNQYPEEYPIIILRNYIGIDKTLQKTLPAPAYGIFLYNGEYRIGSSNSADANFITGCQPILLFGYATAATVNKNSFFCLKSFSPMRYDADAIRPIPVISIAKITNSLVEGTATPLSTVELFYTDNCGAICAPKSHFASINADANGKWNYNAPISGSIIASATLDKMTSEFTSTRITTNDIQTSSSCDGFGSIKGAHVSGAANIKWVNEQGAVVGTELDLVNVPPGKYKLIVSNGSCGDETAFYTIEDVSLVINTTQIQKTNASCNKADGKITGLSYNPAYPATVTWRNSGGAVVGSDIDLLNVPAGDYILTISPADNSCQKIYGPIAITNTTGPNISQMSVTITPTNCGQAIGSITGITATGTGTLKYSWKNEQQQQVGTSRDLLNQPAGKYTLQVTDDTQCGPVYTTALEITQLNGIILDEATIVITISNCSNNNGAITGIKATGATAYKWVDANNIIVSNARDLNNVPTGNYTFTASNSFGCTQTKTYFVGQQAATVYPTYSSTVVNACYGIANGSIAIASNALVMSARWTNNMEVTIGSGNNLINVAPGSYTLYFTDVNGCESFYKTYLLKEDLPLGAPIANNVQVCGEGKAVLTVNNPVPGYSYRLYDSENSIIPLNQQQTGSFTIDVKNDTRYWVSQMKGACESPRKEVKVTVGISKMDIANTFTPNADGINDYWKISGMENSPNAIVQVFNRAGQIVFNSKGYSVPFNGTVNGKDLPIGAYYYIINMGTSGCNTLSGALTIMR